MVGTSGLRERDPGGAHLIGELLRGRTDAGIHLPGLEIVEDEGNLHAVHGLQPALAHGRVVLEAVHVDRRRVLGGLALGLRVDSCSEERTARPDAYAVFLIVAPPLTLATP